MTQPTSDSKACRERHAWKWCLSACGLALASGLGAACSDSDTVVLGPGGVDPGADDPVSRDPGVAVPAAAAGETPAAAPAYALVTLVWSDDGPSGYVALTDSLDPDDVGLEQAREFPGYTSVGVADGQLLVSPSAEDLTIERYRITDSRDWVNTGALSFLNAGAAEVGFYRQYVARDRIAYLDIDITGRVLWDPVEFAIVGAQSETLLPFQRDGLSVYANFNRTNFSFEGSILRPFSYHDEDWLRWSPNTQIVVYDADTHEATGQVDAPCPGLDSITRDEAGNTYLGTWEYSALFPLMGIGAAPCVVRLGPDDALDTSWNTDLTALTGGRQVVNFRYVGDGKAIAAVLHDEEYGDGFDFVNYAQNVDEFWASASRYHRLWMIDVEARTAAPVEGIDAFPFINPGFFHSIIDNRVFVFLGDGSTNNPPSTLVYEIDRSGQASRRFESPGSITQWIRLR
jgi:hypothetical protein